MGRKNRKEDQTACCGGVPLGGSLGAYRVEALVSMDSRGQIVLPKDVREKAGIKAGDKLAVISWESGGRVCCLSLIKAEEFAGTLRNLLGPMMEEMSKP